MRDILSLLEEKNHYLEHFCSLNERELSSAGRGDFENLDRFYSDRERIIEIIRYLDHEIARKQSQVDVNCVSDEERFRLRDLMKIKDQYVSVILRQDLELLAKIESAKTEIIHELRQIKQGRSVVSHYKSPIQTKRLIDEA